jgi:hypothetical protein
MYREKGLESYKGTMKDFLEKIKLECTKENKKDRLKSENEYDFNCLVTNVYVNDSNLIKMKMSIN